MLKISTNNKTKSSERLSSGYRINRAADDAAGLSISEKMRMQIRGLDKASKNVNDGISAIQVADGALAEVHSMLDRMKQLSVQAANDVNTDDDRAMIQDEIDQLLTEIDRIGSDTEFNTCKIFQGGYTDILDEHGNPVPISNIGFQDFQLARADLLNYPFTNNSNGKYLKLAVSTSDNYTAATWNLIFGSGSTSNSTIRYSYLDDNGSKVTGYSDIADMSITNCVINNNGADMTADSISIIDADCALPFSEKIKWDSANSPTSVSIGDWTRK